QTEEAPEFELTLERDDGRLLASRPADERRIGAPVEPPIALASANGRTVAAGTRLSGQPGLLAARTLLHGQLRIAASLPLATAYAAFQRDRAMIWAVTALFCAVVLTGAT